MPKASRKKLIGLLKIIVSIVLLALVWRAARSEGNLSEILRGANVWMLLAAAVIFAAGQIVAAFRLRYALMTLHRRFGPGTILRAHFIGVTFNQILPTGFGGDIAKVALLRTPGDTGRITRGVLLVRTFGLAAFLLLSALLVPFYDRVLTETRPFYVIAAVSALIVGGLFLAVLFARSRDLVNRLPRPLRAVALLLTDIRRFARPKSFTEQAVTSALLVLSVIFCFTLLGRALGHPASVLSCLVMVPPVVISMHLPLSFGGWGVREVGAVALLPLGGFPTQTAFLVSVLYGIVILTCGLAGLVLWLLPTTRIDSVSREASVSKI